MRLIYLFIFIVLSSSDGLFGQSAFYVRDGLTLSLDPNASIYISGDLQIENTTDTANFRNQGKIEVGGSIHNNTASQIFEFRDGNVEMSGSSGESINGNFTFNDLIINNSGGVSINSGTSTMTGTLFLDNGALNTNGRLVLNSDEIGTARINEITSGSINGDVTVERYVDSTGYAARFVGSSVIGTTLADWLDDIVFSGFPGSTYPGWRFNNVYYYDETVLGTGDNGYSTATDISNPVPVGEGLQIYFGFSKAVLDVTGPVNTGPTNLPVTFTDDPAVSNDEDGWVMVSNPYPSAIDWESNAWVKINVDDAIYIYDGTNEVYASYSTGSGLGTNGGSRYIASSQSFWVHCNANSPILQANEGIKVPNDPDFIESAPYNYLRISIEDSMSMRDEVILNFDPKATSAFDHSYDAYKLYAYSNSQIALIHNSKPHSILSLADTSTSNSIEIETKVLTSGSYELKFNNQLVSNSCIILEDLFTGRIENIADSASFHFWLSDTTTVPRFRLKLGRRVDIKIGEPECHGERVEVVLKNNFKDDQFKYSLRRMNSNFYFEDSLKQHYDTLILNAGQYRFQLSEEACPTYSEMFEVIEADSISTSVQLTYDSIFGHHSAIALSTGGIPPYSYQWKTNPKQVGDTAFGLRPGWYEILVTDDQYCRDTIEFNVPLVTQISALESLEVIKMYPTPVEDKLTIEGVSETTFLIELYTLDGKRIFSNTYSGKQQIDFSSYSSGIYIVKIQMEDELYAKKIKKK